MFEPAPEASSPGRGARSESERDGLVHASAVFPPAPAPGVPCNPTSAHGTQETPVSTPLHPPRLRPGAGDAQGRTAAVDLVEQARAGRLEAWSALYQEHYPRLYRHVRFLAGDQAHTEDLVQEVFARALIKLADFDGRSAFSTWLHGIAVNVVRNFWRSQKTKADAHARLAQLHAVQGGAEDRLDHIQLCKQRARLVYAILEDLPEHLREAFMLRDLEGLSPAEAAAQLGITPGNLAVRACRARERIRKELETLGVLAPREAP